MTFRFPRSTPWRLETAPPPDVFADVAFAAITCRAYKDINHKDGFHVYEALAALGPKFITPNGDNVHYDGADARATTVPVARPGGTSAITFRLHDVFGTVVYEYRRKKG